MRERIVVGMSGGVDSSVAAALLVEQGFDVVGITMRVAPAPAGAEPASRFGSCCGTEATEDARRVARSLGIRHYLLNMEDEFEQKVIGRFVAAYGAGRTPVPCVACNSELKFGSLLGRARAWDALAVATGHYARLGRDPVTGRHLLLRAMDARKDQTDFLWPLSQAQLAAARFGEAGDLDSDRVVAEAVNFIACEPPRTPLRVEAKIRHSHRPAAATVCALEGNRAHVAFDTPQRAASPGQSVVFYDGDVVVGGGVIAHPS